MNEDQIYKITTLFCLVSIWQHQLSDHSPIQDEFDNLLNNSQNVLTLHKSDDRKISNFSEKKNSRYMLKNYFPDWPERVSFEEKQSKLYSSAKAKLAEIERVRSPLSIKLTVEEKDAFDYYEGKNFYSRYQNIETAPNVFDSRRSFLLKIEKNPQMLETFLNSYVNREQKE